MSVISYLTTVRFEVGALRALADELGRAGIRRPLVVADRGIVAAGLSDRLKDAIGAIAFATFSDTPPNPTEAAVRFALQHYRDEGCDGLVGFGGGSPIDLAKAVALAATHDGPLSTYAAAHGGMERIGARAAPVVAVPTTAGSGSEVGRATVIVMDDGAKRAIASPHLVPRAALCDPSLTTGLSPQLTAGTGMDAIAHCVETFLSPCLNPPADAIAMDGLARGIRHIAVAAGSRPSLEVRAEMMMCALEGGLAFQKGLGAVHALSHPMGALRELTIHHGTANAILLPAVLRFHAPHVPEKMQRIAEAIAAPSAAAVPDCFRSLLQRLELPANLAALGITRDLIPPLAAAAMQDFSHATNPHPPTEADYRTMLAEALG